MQIVAPVGESFGGNPTATGHFRSNFPDDLIVFGNIPLRIEKLSQSAQNKRYIVDAEIFAEIGNDCFEQFFVVGGVQFGIGFSLVPEDSDEIPLFHRFTGQSYCIIIGVHIAVFIFAAGEPGVDTGTADGNRNQTDLMLRIKFFQSDGKGASGADAAAAVAVDFQTFDFKRIGGIAETESSQPVIVKGIRRRDPDLLLP